MARIEPRQLAAWFDAHAASLVLYARQWVSRPAAEDIVQDVFIRLASQRHAPENIRAWLLISVRHGAFDALKTSGRRHAREKQAGENRGRLFEMPPENALDAADVQESLERLAAAEREIITLRIWGGATFEEISRVMEMPLSRVYSRYRSALDLLRARWEPPCPKK